MLARAWWPVQSWCRQRPVTVVASVIVITTLLGNDCWQRLPTLAQFSQGQVASLGVTASALAFAARAPGPLLGALWALVLAALVATVGGPLSAGTFTLLCGGSSAALLPVLWSLGRVRHAGQIPAAAAHGVGFLVPASVPGALALLTLGSVGIWPALGGAVAVLAGAILPVAWCRTAPARSEPPLPVAALFPRIDLVRPLQILVLVVVTLGLISVGLRAMNDATLPAQPFLLALPMLIGGTWFGLSGQVRVAVVATVVSLGWLGYAFLPRDAAATSQLAMSFALAQFMPLALWVAREQQRPWPMPLLIGIGVVPALTLADQNLATATLGATLAGCLAVAVCATRPLPPAAAAADANTALRRAQRALQRLAPSWHHYGVAKLRYDPVYRQLAERPAWGRVLDAGCGSGLVAALAAARGEPSYLGIDLDDDKLSVAARTLQILGQQLDDNWQLLRARLPLEATPNERFDSAMLIDVLHYWPEAEQRALLTQLHTALRPQGRLFLRDGCADADGDAGRVTLGERFTTAIGLNPATGGLHFLSDERMRSVLVDVGFAVEECLPSGAENRLWCCLRR